MALVPSSYPKEPGAAKPGINQTSVRCGDSYLTLITVNGEIPGTDFTGGFSKVINPVPIVGSSSVVPRFKSWMEFNTAMRRPYGLRERLEGVEQLLDDESNRFSQKERTALHWLIATAWGLLNDATLGANTIKSMGDAGSNKARKFVVETLKHLRCAEYWAWRVILHGQALEVYDPPPTELGLSAHLLAPPFDAPSEGALPPPPPPPETPPETPPTTTPSRTAAKKKDNTGLIVFGLGVLVAGAIFLPKLLKR
jgi:hypothetical protein